MGEHRKGNSPPEKTSSNFITGLNLCCKILPLCCLSDISSRDLRNTGLFSVQWKEHRCDQTLHFKIPSSGKLILYMTCDGRWENWWKVQWKGQSNPEEPPDICMSLLIGDSTWHLAWSKFSVGFLFCVRHNKQFPRQSSSLAKWQLSMINTNWLGQMHSWDVAVLSSVTGTYSLLFLI